MKAACEDKVAYEFESLPASRLLEASCKSGPNLEKRGFGRVSGRGSFKRHLQLAQDLQGGWFAWYASATCGFPFSFVLAVCLSLVSTVTICSEKPRKLYMFGQGDEVFRSSFPPKPNWNYIEYLSTRASQSCVKSLWQRRGTHDLTIETVTDHQSTSKHTLFCCFF